MTQVPYTHNHTSLSISICARVCRLSCQKNMAAARQRLQDYLNSLKDEGIMDGQYEQTRTLQGENNPQIMLELITSYCQDSDSSVREMAVILSEPVVDYARVTVLAHQIKGGGCSLGGCKVVVASRDLRDASDSGDKQRCCEAYDRTTNAYYNFREKLRTLYQMERAIITNDARNEARAARRRR